MTTTNARTAIAARRCVSRFAAADVRRWGRMSWTRWTSRVTSPPAAVRARVAEACTAATPPVTLSARGMGERSGTPASGSAGLTGTSVRDRWVDATSVASNAIIASLPLPSAAKNR